VPHALDPYPPHARTPIKIIKNKAHLDQNLLPSQSPTITIDREALPVQTRLLERLSLRYRKRRGRVRLVLSPPRIRKRKPVYQDLVQAPALAPVSVITTTIPARESSLRGSGAISRRTTGIITRTATTTGMATREATIETTTGEGTITEAAIAIKAETEAISAVEADTTITEMVVATITTTTTEIATIIMAATATTITTGTITTTITAITAITMMQKIITTVQLTMRRPPPPTNRTSTWTIDSFTVIIYHQSSIKKYWHYHPSFGLLKEHVFI
jgi:hypothetical protein